MEPLGMPRRRLLLADADRGLAAALRGELESAGYEVKVAFDGGQALAQQRRWPSDVLVVELVMPECDGFEAIESFKREFPATRIVAVSGGGRLRASLLLTAAALIGVDATLQKPFDADALVRALRSLEASAALLA
jgi:CheY-like chemotaxis protein